MGWLQVETDRYENGSGWILERDGMFGWILYNEEIEDEFPDTFVVLSDLFTNPGLSVITLDPTTGKIPTEYIPALAINDTFTVSSQVGMLSLNAQRGDIAIRTEIPGPGMFILSGDDAGYLPNWIPITTQFPDWNNIRNKPTEYPSVPHDHDSRYYTKSETDSFLLQKRNISTPIPATEVTEDVNHRFVSDAEKNQWNNPDSPKWLAIQNKPITFPPDSHDHDARYYTKTQTDSFLLQKRNTDPIPAAEIVTDSTHRFVTDAQISSWGGSGLTNPLNQDINFATGRLLRLNNVPIAGWLDDGTPFYKKRFVFIMTTETVVTITHGINNAATNLRIIGYDVYGKNPVVGSTPNLIGPPMYIPSQINYSDTIITFRRSDASLPSQFCLTITYI
ncbi:hypothetical protein LEP1GSC079_0002 [Leptospira interrogans str. FPW1039]|uniref:Uncharacterized protein n=2 Tax=Leptospira interrogans TaxID=173 RepID=A0A0F6IG80_LEPIR|nr:hypothetical protein [Leptospira interrogans]EMF44525.1 hypothetical protein LEP1GSC067_3634 [Leptospira interrogans serovar Lora str. TE 1992]EMJ37055.1 hypothetical protein LEP1GSC079_0002 [Leptospira interrogans str. FPW1039]